MGAQTGSHDGAGGDIVHLMPPSAFLPFVASVFEEAAPSRNRFLIYGDNHVSAPLAVRLKHIAGDDTDADVDRTLADVSGAAALIVHGMSTFSARVLARTPPSMLRVWSGWGGEYAGSALDPMSGLLGRATARLVHRGRGPVERLSAAHSARYVDRLLRAAARSTDVFSAPVPTDFAVFRRRFRGFAGRYHQLNYASVEDTYGTPPDRATGDDILVGNSATPENNHIELFQLLAEVGVGARRVVVPLSYGDAAYADDVVAVGRELLGDAIIAVRSYLPLEEYNELLARCGTVVMGHHRQQALGNVARAVWQGASLFLDRRSPILAYLRAQGISSRPLEELRRDGLPSARNDADVIADRRIARKLWGRDVVVDNVRALIDEV